MDHRVVTLLTPGVGPFEFAVACEVFGRERPTSRGDWYHHRMAAVTRPVVVEGGWTLDVAHGLEAVDDAQTVIVPACPLDPPAVLVDALRGAHERGARIVSFCSGAFALAAAGLLSGRRATTHWMLADELARRHPDVEVDADVLYVDDGTVLTAAGTAAAIDLALHLVRADLGADTAARVAQRMVVAPHRDAATDQRLAEPIPRSPYPEDGIRAVLQWLQEHLDHPVSVDDLACMAAMSTRTLTRRFRAATGTTPLRWITHQRVVRAQHLLETTDLPVEVVARRVGIGTAANLRQHFGRETGLSPSAYRAHHLHATRS